MVLYISNDVMSEDSSPLLPPLVLALLFVPFASSAPTKSSSVAPRSDLETSNYVGYTPEPNGRGTSSLVLSCLLTLVLCVWSALHLNVPRQSESSFTTVLTYLRWIFTGVWGPELVVFTAWRQWCSARVLGRMIKEMDKTSKPGKEDTFTKPELSHTASTSPTEILVSGRSKQRRNTWTMTHSFFASTGGFAFDLSHLSEDEQFLPKECPQRLALTARGVALLVKCGILPDIAEADILDKSKANGLAKALVLVQALWLLVQVIGRLIAKLPVTLLEVNTVAHV